MVNEDNLKVKGLQGSLKINCTITFFHSLSELSRLILLNNEMLQLFVIISHYKGIDYGFHGNYAAAIVTSLYQPFLVNATCISDSIVIDKKTKTKCITIKLYTIYKY